MQTNLSIIGEREQGQDVRSNNVTAVSAIANIVKTSLGPQGLDKMLVDEIGDVTVTNDGATILSQLEVEHPAAKVLVELSQLQDKEVGDGTTSVVILAAELLKRANELVKQKIHPTSIISGYRRAMKECVAYIKNNLTLKVDALGRESLINVAKTSMSSKVIGPESEYFSEMVVNAMQAVKMTNQQGHVKYPVKAVRILQCHGMSLKDSRHINGYALQMGRAAQGCPLKVSGAKIAFVDFNLNKFRLKMGISIMINDPAQIGKIRDKEIEITKERCQKILDAGANVVVTSKGIDDLALKYFVERGVIALRRVSKDDIRRLAKTTGGSVCTTMANSEGDETFDQAYLGQAEEVAEERVGDNDFIFFKGTKTANAQTILLRGANEFLTSEAERSVHDSLCAVKRVLESNIIVAGGGSVETALSVYLEDFAKTFGSKEQLAIAEFAESLNVIPKCLAVNAAKDATELVAQLRVFHHAAQMNLENAKESMKYSGLDLVNGKIKNNVKVGVLEPAISKIKSLRFATEAAITLLRIDDLIKLDPQEEQQGPRGH